MDVKNSKKMADNKIIPIELKANSNREFFLIHGYTGSVDDFQELPYLLNKRFNANVRVISLPGHGTKVEDLDNVTYDDFVNYLANELEKDLKKGREIVLGGVSLGGLLALLLASRYSVGAVFNVSSPYVLKFPFNSTLLKMVAIFIKYWKKSYTSEKEERVRKNSSSYTHMHRNGLKIVEQLNTDLKSNLIKVTSPILTINSIADHLSHRRATNAIHSSVGSKVRKKRIFTMRQHNVFLSYENNEVNGEIINFIEKNNIFPGLQKQKEKITAIIPAYNEASRIGAVLRVITVSSIINDIVVVDDGSTDNTENEVRKFKNVRYLKNNSNLGKAQSLEIGVKSTNADILFFCDADLIGLTSEIVQSIVTPVLSRQFDMFIGLRSNIMQKTVHLFAINSGERALTREVWEKLPKYFKYKYRVEAGLNYYVNKYFSGYGYKTFDYSQPIKEKKYGFIKGTYLRWKMNLDVLSAYVREIFE